MKMIGRVLHSVLIGTDDDAAPPSVPLTSVAAEAAAAAAPDDEPSARADPLMLDGLLREVGGLLNNDEEEELAVRLYEALLREAEENGASEYAAQQRYARGLCHLLAPGECAYDAVGDDSYAPLYWATLAGEPSGAPRHCRAVAALDDTFVVSKRLDHVLGIVVEAALLEHFRLYELDEYEEEDEAAAFATEAQIAARARHALMRRLCARASERVAERGDALQLCRERHDPALERLCPLEWTIYTKKSSLFYRFCKQVLLSDPLVDFAVPGEYALVEALPFYLVLLLCGEHLVPPGEAPVARRFSDTNAWIRVPLWFLPLWYADPRHRHGAGVFSASDADTHL